MRVVVECPKPPAWTSRPDVHVVGFSEAWQTGYVEMRGLPDVLRCGVDEFKLYCETLHELLVRAYDDIGVSFPVWRSWDSYVRKWPWIARAKKRRVHVLKPLE